MKSNVGTAGKLSTYVVADQKEEFTLLTGLDDEDKQLPPLKALSFLDRFLVVWIILAMAIGIVIGNTVDSVGPALQKGEFVGVSIPIGVYFDNQNRRASY